MKAYSPKSTVSICSGVVNSHSNDVKVENVSQISDYAPFINDRKIDRLVTDVTLLMDEINIIQDSTNLYDENFRICARGIDDNGLWVQ